MASISSPGSYVVTRTARPTSCDATLGSSDSAVSNRDFGVFLDSLSLPPSSIPRGDDSSESSVSNFSRCISESSVSTFDRNGSDPGDFRHLSYFSGTGVSEHTNDASSVLSDVSLDEDLRPSRQGALSSENSLTSGSGCDCDGFWFDDMSCSSDSFEVRIRVEAENIFLCDSFGSSILIVVCPFLAAAF